MELGQLFNYFLKSPEALYQNMIHMSKTSTKGETIRK